MVLAGEVGAGVRIEREHERGENRPNDGQPLCFCLVARGLEIFQVDCSGKNRIIGR